MPGEVGQRAFAGEGGGGGVERGVARAVEAVFGAGVDVDVDVVAAAEAGADLRHRALRHARVVSREVHEQRTGQRVGLVEIGLDAHPVVAHRGLDRMARGAQVRELAAQAEAHDADPGGTVRSQARDAGAEIGHQPVHVGAAD